MEKLETELVALEPFQQRAVELVQGLVRDLWSDALIEIYGSNYTRLALPKSDVDCVLISKTFGGNTPLEVLHKLADAVKDKPWASSIELLLGAKIPVLKLVYRHVVTDDESGAQENTIGPAGVSTSETETHPETKTLVTREVMLDITCGHSTGHSGLSARDLVYSYQAEMPALRPLVMSLKSHLHHHGTCRILVALFFLSL